MASIEIDIEEYNSYQKIINRLHDEKFNLMQQVAEKETEIESLKENIEIVKNANFFDRLFSWKQILKLISE